MKSAENLTVLILTPLDYRLQRNNVEHNRAEQYVARGARVTVLYKRMNQSRRIRDLLRDTLTLRVREFEEDGVRLVEVDPFFNYFAGLRKDSEERPRTPTDSAQSSASERPRRSLGLLLVRLLSPLAVLRDLAFAPCALLVALLKLRKRSDVCLGIGAWGGLIGIPLRGFGRVGQLVYEDRDFEPGLMPDRLRQAYTGALERYGIRRADLVVSVGHLLAALRREQTGREPHVLPNGVDWHRYAEARRAPKDGQRLVYVGNVISWSGLDLTLRALTRIAETHRDVTLSIVGDGLPGYVQQLRELVRELELESRVTFHGQQPPAALPEFLANADVGLANSEPVSFRRYACPLKVIEYMAAGLPVVATTDTEAAQLVAAAKAGIAVPYEVDSVAAELTGLLGDRERRASLSRGGVAASEKLDWSRLVDQELNWIEERGT